jgi:hypothetical protein
MKHIEFAKLIEKYEGSLSLTGEQEILDHLSSCSECSLMSKKLDGFFGYMQADNSSEIPQNVTANLLNIYQPNKLAPKIEKESFIKRLFGELIFDDWQFALSERLAFTDMRQMLYKTSDFDIDLRLQFINGKCLVSGQVFPDLKEKGTVKITSESGETKADLNENCEFILTAVPEGNYNLQIDITDTRIEISNIALLS